MKVDLLDHGYIRMVSYTQPNRLRIGATDVEIYNHMKSWNGDLEIVRAARVSYDADWRSGEDSGKDEKLIHRLWRDGHTSPFEAMTFSFEVQAPIFVFRQWHRHRTQSYSEVSARYTELPDMFYVPKADHIGDQDKENKQGRNGVHQFAHNIANEIHDLSRSAHLHYKKLLETGMTRELARLILPVNTYSRMYASANLLNWFRFLTLRTDPHAQYEIRVYAVEIAKMIETVCPIAVAAWRESVEKADDAKS